MDALSPIKEDLLHYVWRTHQFELTNLLTTDGDAIEILSFGTLNSNAGPDFTNGQVRIGNTRWAGNIEMHVFSSQWKAHQHHTDPAYDNVILHVVFEADVPVRRNDGSNIPCLELKDRINPGIRANYLQLMQNDHWIPCQELIGGVPKSRISLWLHRLMVERLQRKTNDIQTLLEKTSGHWEQVGFIMLGRYLGGKVNGLPMEILTSSIPINILYKNRHQPNAVEAILFGLAGFLSSRYQEDYPNHLRREWKFYQKKYAFTIMNPVIWKFGRMRPANFPTLRLAQLVAILQQQEFLFRNMMETNNLAALSGLFEVTASEYWDTHYRFDHPTKSRPKKLGKSFIEMLCINVVAPLLFSYGSNTSQPAYQDKSIALLESVRPEQNSIISNWATFAYKANNASDSQALLQLKNEYCNQHKCLHCAIGSTLLQKT